MYEVDEVKHYCVCTVFSGVYVKSFPINLCSFILQLNSTLALTMEGNAVTNTIQMGL